MKSSIKALFDNLILLLFIATFVSGILTLALFVQNSSNFKIDNLNNQKVMIDSLTKLQKEDLEIALIQLNGKGTQLHHEIEKLKNHYAYDFLNIYLLGNSDKYFAELQTLSTLTKSFNDEAKIYYTETNPETKQHDFDETFNKLIAHINHMLLQELTFNQEKSYLLQKVSLVIFLILLYISFWNRKKLLQIHKDILFLYSIDNNKKNYVIFTQEVDAIAMRMKRKPTTSDNPSMIDPVTEINNNKGLVHSYAEKKGMKDTNFTSVTIFEVDNFSKTNRAFAQDFTQAILKKIAFTMTLHEQATDVIARTDYNQFTLVFSRASKEQLYKDMDTIRQSISEIKFKNTETDSLQITVTGGFIIKTNHISLEEAIRQAKEVLDFAKSTSYNKIAQLSDLAQKHL